MRFLQEAIPTLQHIAEVRPDRKTAIQMLLQDAEVMVALGEVMDSPTADYLSSQLWLGGTHGMGLSPEEAELARRIRRSWGKAKNEGRNRFPTWMLFPLRSAAGKLNWVGFMSYRGDLPAVLRQGRVVIAQSDAGSDLPPAISDRMNEIVESHVALPEGRCLFMKVRLPEGVVKFPETWVQPLILAAQVTRDKPPGNILGNSWLVVPADIGSLQLEGIPFSMPRVLVQLGETNITTGTPSAWKEVTPAEVENNLDVLVRPDLEGPSMLHIKATGVSDALPALLHLFTER